MIKGIGVRVRIWEFSVGVSFTIGACGSGARRLEPFASLFCDYLYLFWGVKDSEE